MPRIVCFSDTHNEEIPLPEGDILIHAGDATFTGSEDEIKKFQEYMARQPHETKIFVPGNHELSMDYQHRKYRHINWQDWLNAGVKVITLGESIKTHGLNIGGTPLQPAFGNWAFGKSEWELGAFYDLIPGDTNILITHCPPFGILDGPDKLGSKALRNRLDELSKGSDLFLHVFGHIHEGAGQTIVGNTFCANVSILDEKYKVKNKPFVFDL